LSLGTGGEEKETREKGTGQATQAKRNVFGKKLGVLVRRGGEIPGSGRKSGGTLEGNQEL